MQRLVRPGALAWLTHFIKRMFPGEYCTKSVFTRPPHPTQRGPSPAACASPIGDSFRRRPAYLAQSRSSLPPQRLRPIPPAAAVELRIDTTEWLNQCWSQVAVAGGLVAWSPGARWPRYRPGSLGSLSSPRAAGPARRSASRDVRSGAEAEAEAEGVGRPTVRIGASV